MKKLSGKLLLATVMFAAVITTAEVKAQEPAAGTQPATTTGKAHQKGDVILTPAIGLGNWGYYRGSYGFPFVFTADFAVHDYVDVGPFAGFVANGNYFAIIPGARANFNFWQLADDKAKADLKGDVLDIYYSLGFGYEIFVNSNFRGADRFRWHSNLGLRWYFRPHIALSFEFGAPVVAPAAIGISFKL